MPDVACPSVKNMIMFALLSLDVENCGTAVENEPDIFVPPLAMNALM